MAIVSALTPGRDPEPYLRRFRERSWNLFRDYLYDDLAASGDAAAAYSFDLNDHDSPHDPIPIIWTLGFAAGASLRDLEQATVASAYTGFLNRFDDITASRFDETAV